MYIVNAHESLNVHEKEDTEIASNMQEMIKSAPGKSIKT